MKEAKKSETTKNSNNKLIKFFSNKSIFKKYGAFIILLFLMAVLTFLSPFFLSVSNLRNVAIQTAVIGLLTMAQTMVIITQGIDLSGGAFLALNMVIGAILITYGVPFWLVIILMLIFGMLLGGVNAFIITKLNITPFIVTLGTMSMARGLALVFTGGTPVSRLPNIVHWFGRGNILAVPVPIIILVFSAFLLSFILKYTPIGRYAYALGSNEEAARFSGVNVEKYKAIIYILAGLLAAVAGLIMMGRLGSAHPTAGQGYELNAIAGAVIGGASLMGGEGTIFGGLVGAFIMTVLSNGFTLLGVTAFWQQFALGAIVVIAVAVDINIRKE